MKKIVVMGSSRDPVIMFYKRFLMRMGIGRGRYCFINSDNFAKGVDVNDEGWFLSGSELRFVSTKKILKILKIFLVINLGSVSKYFVPKNLFKILYIYFKSDF